MNTSLLVERLKKVGWHYTANQLDGLLEDASKNNLTYSAFLYTLLTHEIEQKESVAFQRRMVKAKLPFRKTVHEFDFGEKREFENGIDNIKQINSQKERKSLLLNYLSKISRKLI